MRAMTIILLAAFTLSVGAMAILADQAQPGKKTDEERIIGTWSVVKGQEGGNDIWQDFANAVHFAFTKSGTMGMAVLGTNEKQKDFAYKIVGPGNIDIGEPGTLWPGIYKFDNDDKVMICFVAHREGKRPEKLESPKDTRTILLVLERAKAEEKMTPEEKAKRKVAIEKARLAAAGRVSVNNLRQLAEAMNNYHDQNKTLPTHAIYSMDGKTPLLSWRVAILPFIEQNLPNIQFKLDEPWDSEHNKKLIAKMPAIFESPVPDKKKEGMTYYQVFTGPDTAFDGPKKLKFNQITDGTSNTIMIIEAKEPVIWTKPADLELPKDKTKLPELGGLFPDLMYFAMCDASVLSAHNVQEAAILRPLITPSAGDAANLEKLKGIK